MENRYSPEDLGILRLGLKRMVVEECNVKNVNPSDIPDEDALIGGNRVLRLDSLDAVEIVMAIERVFHLKIEKAGLTKQIFKSFITLSDYISETANIDKVSLFIKLNS